MWFGVRLLAKAKIGGNFSKSFLVDIFWPKTHVGLIVYQIVKDPKAYYDRPYYILYLILQGFRPVDCSLEKVANVSWPVTVRLKPWLAPDVCMMFVMFCSGRCVATGVSDLERLPRVNALSVGHWVWVHRAREHSSVCFSLTLLYPPPTRSYIESFYCRIIQSSLFDFWH